MAANATQEEIRTAYRKLARRWHPDRFQAGPEREWANDRMAAINAAYQECLRRRSPQGTGEEAAQLKQVQQLIDDGQFLSARELLMGVSTRCAEWNYLFGALLMRTSEFEKGILYLSVAAHQRPEELKYARALAAARRTMAEKRRRILPRFGMR